MRIKRIVFINRAPFINLDLDLSDKQVVSLTGINGAGKTTILSYVVDAFYEIARRAFQNEFSGVKENQLYRISSSLYNMAGASKSMVYISFDLDGKEIHYIDLLGINNENDFNELLRVIWKNEDPSKWDITYGSISNQLRSEAKYVRYVSIDESNARKAFNDGLLTYFPSYRYEQPGYLNDVFRMELSYKNMSELRGYLNNPIEVASDLPQIANWMMDVVLDAQIYNQNELLQKLQQVISIILSNKHRKAVRIGIGQRNLGGARIQIVDAKTAEMIYPTIFNISAGEAALICVFGELLKQTDRVGKNAKDIKGIVLVDEVDKHLHIVLQKEVIPLLVQFFPNIQFIFSTHSAFVNIGLTDSFKDVCSILDLDNNGVECDVDKSKVFREAYDVMTEENRRYAYFYNALSEKIKTINIPIVHLEGRTDELYFKKAFEIFGYDNASVDFQWIGHLDEAGNEVFTGADSLNQGLQYIRGRKTEKMNFFLFDCDTKRQESDETNIIVMTIPYYESHTVMNKGIENALNLEDIDLEVFYDKKTRTGDYGNVTERTELNKMKMCKYICGLDAEVQKKILENLKPVIDRIISRIEGNNIHKTL